MLNLIFIIPCFIFVDAQIYHVTDFNATGDGVTDDTLAVRATLAAAANTNGGQVIFDEGYTFLTGAFNVTSNITLDVRGTILAWNGGDEFHYPLVPMLPWQAPPHDRERQAFIQSHNATNITLTGGGIVDGQGYPWWKCSWNESLSPCNNIRRPYFVRFIFTTNVKVHDITLKDSPAWCLYLAWVTTAHIYKVNITTPDLPIAHNTDGMDIDCSVDVLIENCHYQGSDDAVTMAAGYNNYGRTYGRATQNVTVRNFTIFNSTNSAMSVGSETSGGIRNITYENIWANHTGAAARIKSARGRGGIVEDITWNNFTAYNVKDGGVVFTAFYGDKPHNATTDAETPKFKNIRVTNMLVDGGDNGWHLYGLPESPFRIYFENITVKNINNTNLFSRCSGIDGFCDLANPCPPCMNKECPTNWTQSNVIKENCYLLHESTLSWSDALNFCQNTAPLTSLISIDSAFQNIDVVNSVNETFSPCGQVYLGLYRQGSSWIWINGDNGTYINWDTGYPISDPNANCVVLQLNNGKWKNQECSNKQCYLCSFNLNDPN